MEIGELIELLNKQPESNLIMFDFCRATPCRIDSSRGDYSELALDFDFNGECTVKQLIIICENAVGKTYTGYKGGEFRMYDHTSVWVDHYGDWTSTKIISVHDLGYGYSIIATENDEI